MDASILKNGKMVASAIDIQPTDPGQNDELSFSVDPPLMAGDYTLQFHSGELWTIMVFRATLHASGSPMTADRSNRVLALRT